MKATHMTRRRVLGRTGMLMLLGAALLAFGLVGCQSSDSSQGSELTGSTDTGTILEPLTLSAVQANVALKSDQQSLMASILDRYNNECVSRFAMRQQARADGERGMGRRVDGEPPMHALLKESSEILDTDQMVGLIKVIKEQQETMRAQRQDRWANRADGDRPGRGFRGQGGPGGPGSGMFADLDLTAEQQEQLAELREKHQAAMQELRSANGGQRGFGRSEEAEALREQMREETEAILTADQLAQLQANRDERRSERQTAMQEGAVERQEQRVALLTSVLDLSDAQVAQLETILATTHDKMQDLHESLQGERPDRDAMREQMEQIRTETQDAITAMLSDDQKDVFEAMTDLLPSGPHGPRGPQ